MNINCTCNIFLQENRRKQLAFSVCFNSVNVYDYPMDYYHSDQKMLVKKHKKYWSNIVISFLEIKRLSKDTYYEVLKTKF